MSLILKHKNNVKTPWDVIKEAIGKTRYNNQKVYPEIVLLGKGNITNSKSIAENFNNFFTEIGLKLASEIKKAAKTFDIYLKKVNILQPEYPLSINELKKHSFLCKQTKVQVMMKSVLMLLKVVLDL